MKKEYLLIIVVGFFLASYVLNFFAGPVIISIKAPLQFLTAANLMRYPFTAVEIALRTIALFLSVIFLLSLIEKNYFLKAIISLIIGGLGVLFAIQQLATGARVTTIQWTLSFAYAGLFLPLAIIYYLIRGFIEGIFGKLTKEKKENEFWNNKSESKNAEED